MKPLAIAFLIFLDTTLFPAPSANADTPITIDAVCARYPEGDQKNVCYRISRTGYFDPYALELCNTVSNTTLSNSCILTVRNGFFEADAVAACSRLLGDQNSANRRYEDGLAVECLHAIGGARFAPAQVQACDALTSKEDTISCFISSAN